MYLWVREEVEYLCKNLFDQLVSPFKSDIKRSHEASSKSASKIFIFRCQSPTGCMTRSIKFRDNSNSSSHGILNNLSDLLSGIGFFRRKGGVLRQFRMGIQDQRERILVNKMPMKSVHFVVHHGVNGFIYQFDGKEMPGTIDHESSVPHEWFVLDNQRQILNNTVFGFKSWASDSLHESLKSSDKANVCD